MIALSSLVNLAFKPICARYDAVSHFLGDSQSEGGKPCELQAVLQVIMTQALVWVGSVFAPLMPAVGLLSNILQFWTQSMLAMHVFTPPSKAFSASRTSNVAYGLMLGARYLVSSRASVRV